MNNKLKTSISYLVLLMTLSILMTLVGCKDVRDAGKGVKAQAEKYLKDATVLERARGQLSDAQKSRSNLEEIANKFHIDSEVALKEIKRLGEEAEKTRDAFKKLQDAARNAALPKLADATAEDKARSIQIGAKTLTGEGVYRALRECKAQVEKAENKIRREQKRSEFLKDRAGRIREQLIYVDNNITDMESKIADLEVYQELLAVNKTIDALGLSTDKMAELLNTDSILTELRLGIDKAEVQLDLKDQERQIIDLKQSLLDISSFSITDDDLL